MEPVLLTPTESRDQPFWTKLEVVMWITGTDNRPAWNGVQRMQ
jgi:hypothetical protein